jgi:uncharacterized membrane protein
MNILRSIGEWILVIGGLILMAVTGGLAFLFFQPKVTIPLLIAFALIGALFGMKTLMIVLVVLLIIYFIFCIIAIIAIQRMMEAIDAANAYEY